MKYIVSSLEMQACDKNTSDYYGIPSLLLMEKAALAAAEEIMLCRLAGSRVLIAAGTGNNGGDGLAVGRILALKGYDVTFSLIGEKGNCTGETEKQINIIHKYGFSIHDKIENGEYDIIVDALFGTGLGREIRGKYKDAVTQMNQLRKAGKDTLVFSLDIPSGICADTGEIRGCAVAADVTIAFAYGKIGNCLYPGADYTGRLVIKDIGITEESFLGNLPLLFTYDERMKELMPPRNPGGHKGDFGKVLVIAGSPGMSGACELSARACCRCGAGMVKLFTHACNRTVLQAKLPEAMIETYGNGTEDSVQPEDYREVGERLKKAFEWSDCIVIGPGLGQTKMALFLLSMVIRESDLPAVIDADALNLLAENRELQNILMKREKREIVLTPHMGEYKRLKAHWDTGLDREPGENKCTLSEQRLFAKQISCVLVCKDARTAVHEGGHRSYLNLTGNHGMATAGSGDVLAGMIGALMAQGKRAFESASVGVYLHGLAGDQAAAELSAYSMTAMDIAEGIPKVLKDGEGREWEGLGRQYGR